MLLTAKTVWLQPLESKSSPAGNHGHICLTESHTVWLQVDEMDKAVDVAEKRMNQFGLTPQEIRNRRNWVHATRRTVSLVSVGCSDICAAECHGGRGAMPPTEQGAFLSGAQTSAKQAELLVVASWHDVAH